MPTRVHALAGVGVLVEKDNKLLLVRRINAHGAGAWSTPGGHIKFGESPEECAVREVYEETGVTVEEPSFLGITNDVFNAEERQYITVWMAARYVSGEPRVNAPAELDHAGWFDRNDLPEPLFLCLQNLLGGRLYVSW